MEKEIGGTREEGRAEEVEDDDEANSNFRTLLPADRRANLNYLLFPCLRPPQDETPSPLITTLQPLKSPQSQSSLTHLYLSFITTFRWRDHLCTGTGNSFIFPLA